MTTIKQNKTLQLKKMTNLSKSSENVIDILEVSNKTNEINSIIKKLELDANILTIILFINNLVDESNISLDKLNEDASTYDIIEYINELKTISIIQNTAEDLSDEASLEEIINYLNNCNIDPGEIDAIKLKFGDILYNTNMYDADAIDNLIRKIYVEIKTLEANIPKFEEDPIINNWLSSTNNIQIGNNSKALAGNKKNNYSITLGKDSETNSKIRNNYGVAIGYGACAEITNSQNDNNTIAIGHNAKVNQNNSIQLGSGTNNTSGTLQFREYPLVDVNGYIYEERIPNCISASINDVSAFLNARINSNVINISNISADIANLSNELSNLVPEYEQDPIFNKWKNSENVIAGKNSTAVNSSIAIGLEANATNRATAIGYKAEANHLYSIQLGTGTNSSPGTLQFKNYPLVDTNGYIYKERIPYFYTAVEVFPTSISIPAGTIDFKYESNNSEKPTENDGKATSGKYFSKLNIITNVDGVDYVVLSVGKDDYWWKPLSAVPELSGGQCLGKMFSTTLNNDTNTKFSGEVIKNDIPASSEFAFDLLTLRDRNIGYKSIIVDWGDGAVSRGTDTNISLSHKADAQGFGDVVTFSHTYSAPNKKYIVRIYGDFYGLRPRNGKNIISRVFDIDLPIANSHIDFTDLCKSSDRLLKVEIPRLFEFPTGAINLNNTFSNCKNLITFKNYSNIPNVTNMENTFLNCENLKTCRWDMYNGVENIPHSTTGKYKAVYKHCTSLEEDISSLIPANGFENKVVSVSELFYNTPKISCSDEAKLSSYLWGDETVKWIDTENTFKDCSDELRAMVPISWGGTKIE